MIGTIAPAVNARTAENVLTGPKKELSDGLATSVVKNGGGGAGGKKILIPSGRLVTESGRKAIGQLWSTRELNLLKDNKIKYNINLL
ncbi:MAG: hypothetical protein LBP95_11750 [Deltaproteobacteria bacterium]|jgi:hypothetical protein|nr:hypothetical protein [Deltaproteobacteria bacterium]